MQSPPRVAAPGVAFAPTVSVPLHAPVDEAENWPLAMTVEPWVRLIRAKVVPVDGTHGATEETEITVPGGPEMGVAWNAPVWADAGGAARATAASPSVAIPAHLARYLVIATTSWGDVHITNGDSCGPIVGRKTPR
jgi:hypothetical protein